MKRDWDLVRHILLVCEAAPPGELLGPDRFECADLTVLTEHVRMMDHEGFIEARIMGTAPGGFVILEFQWSGHDLLAQMRSETWWSKIKKLAADKGVELTFAVVKELAPIALKAVVGG